MTPTIDEIQRPTAESPEARLEPVDEASDESFPASDPPFWQPLHPGPPGDRPEPGEA